ncbi:hypothetical protein A0256_22055 [Mucilaginibacter sp. PAMC 26640]|nr:hypothetical protein A0256_22055 [Mucilaginibacter sp. PAMC 26640]
MISKTLKTTNGKLEVRIPSQLKEVSIGQMMQLQDAPNLGDIQAISILSGVPLADLQEVTNAADFMVYADSIQNLSHEIATLYNSDAIPKTITVNWNGGPVTVDVTKNLSVEPAGAFMAARDVIADEIAEHIKTYGAENWQDYFKPSLLACAKVLAYYLFCRVTGLKFDETAAANFVEIIKELGVTEALPVAKHFFMNYPDLSKPKTGFWQQVLPLLKKGLAYILSKSLGISIP